MNIYVITADFDLSSFNSGFVVDAVLKTRAVNRQMIKGYVKYASTGLFNGKQVGVGVSNLKCRTHVRHKRKRRTRNVCFM